MVALSAKGVDNVDYSTENRSGSEQHKIYDYSQCLWNDITSTEAGDGQGIGIFPIPIATPSDHVSQNSNWEVGTNNLSIGSGTKAILNGSVMGDLVNNGMLIVSGDRADSVQGDGGTGPLGTHLEPPYGGWPLRAIDLCCEMWALIQAWDNDDIEVRSNASEEALQAIKKEANRIEEQLEREFAGDLLADGTFSVDQPSRWDIREAELRDFSCVFQLLRNASESSNEEVSARAKDVFLKFEPPLNATFSLDD